MRLTGSVGIGQSEKIRKMGKRERRRYGWVGESGRFWRRKWVLVFEFE